MDELTPTGLSPEARHAMEQLASEIGGLRPLGATAQQVLRITADDRFSAYEIANVIAADQALTTRMLRLANSAYYGFARRITTMRDAVVLLGFREVRASTLAACVIDAVPPSNHIGYERFWHYSLTIGMLGEVLARADRQQPDEAFTAGVIHNIGRLALDQHCPARFGEVLACAQQHQISVHEAERRVFGFTDAQLGGALGRQWDLPPVLIEAIERHPEPMRHPSAAAALALDPIDPVSLAGFVVRARAFAASSGASDGVEPGSPRSEPPAEWLVAPLSSTLARAGGVDGIGERVSAFLANAVSA